MHVKRTWRVFWDLQCPYSKRMWKNFTAIKERFSDDFDFEISLTSLLFHPQAFTAQCGASLIEREKGRDVMFKYVDACFENQESYLNDAIGDAKKSEIAAVFASIAENAGIFDDKFTKEIFLRDLNDWEKAAKPAYTEHKKVLAYGAYSTPSNAIDEKLVLNTESAWGPDEWAEKLKSL